MEIGDAGAEAGVVALAGEGLAEDVAFDLMREEVVDDLFERVDAGGARFDSFDAERFVGGIAGEARHEDDVGVGLSFG